MKRHYFLLILFALCSLGAKAESVDVADIASYKVQSVSQTAATSITEGTWYLLEAERNSGAWTPAYDDGSDAIMRATSTNVVAEGAYGSDIAKYLVRFVETGTTSEKNENSTVYYIQFATGNYFADASEVSTWSGDVSATSEAANAGKWNLYLIGSSESEWGINVYDMAGILDNNGPGSTVALWETGEVTTTGGNNDWELFEVTLVEMTENDYNVKALTELLDGAQTTYDANSLNPALITSVDQLSSNLTETSEGSLAGLIDGDASTYWQSEWSDYVTRDQSAAYIEIALPEDYTGGEVEISITRRDQHNNQVDEMKIVSVTYDSDGNATETSIVDDLSLPFTAVSETVTNTFTIPEGTTTIRLYGIDTAQDSSGSQSNAGNWHLAELQLYDLTVDPINEQYEEAAETFATAIATAKAAIEGGTVSTSDIETLQAAIDAYEEAISGETQSDETEATEPTAVETNETDISHWTTTGNNGSHELNTWSWEGDTDGSGMTTPFCQNYVWEGDDASTTLGEATISHTKLTDLEAGYYYVSLEVRLYAANGETIEDGTYLEVNGVREDIVDDGTTGEYGDTAKEVYGTYAVTAEVDDTGTLDISINIPDGATYNWLAWKNLNVIYLGDDITYLGYVTGTMNADEEAAMQSAIDAYNADNTDANLAAAVDAIVTACASVDYYATVKAAIDEALDNLDEAGQASLNASDLATGYEDGSLADGTDVTVDISTAYLAQTTAGSDMTYALVNSGTWAIGDGQGNGPSTCPSLTTATETYNDDSNFAIGDVLYKTLTGLQEGYYEVSFYAQINEANFDDLNTGENISQAYANDETADMSVGTNTSANLSDADLYTFTVKVTDGTLKIGVANVAEGGNWCYCQEVSLTLLADPMECVYLYNVAADKFLSRVYTTDNYTAVDPYGIPLDITFNGSNQATIKFLDSETYLRATNWGHTDGDPSSATTAMHPCTFTVKEVENVENGYGTVYQFLGGGTGSGSTDNDVEDETLYFNASDNYQRVAVNGTSDNVTDDTQTYWVIVDKDTRNAIKDAWVQAQKDAAAEALGVDDIDNYAAANAGTDCTSSVTGAALAGDISAWTSTAISTGATFSTNTNGTELYQATATLSQTVTGLTPGVYKVTLQGLHRMGTNANSWELGEAYEDLDLSVAYLKANDDQINLKPWYVAATRTEVATDYYTYVPDDMAGAGTACDNGDYTNTVYTIVEADNGETTGSLTITIGCPSTISANWMFVKNLTLTLLDAPNLFMNEDPENPGTYYGTFSSTTDRSLVDGVTASYLLAGGVDPEGTDEGEEWGTLTFTDVDGIAAGEGYLCTYEGEAGNGTMEFSLPAATSEVTAPEGNLLVAVSAETSGADLGDYAYVLSAVDDVVGFYVLDDEATIAAGKAYADLSSVLGETDVKLFKIVFGTSTGIETITPVSVSTDAIYDLAGRKVSKPVKGSVYISGGKKVLY